MTKDEQYLGIVNNQGHVTECAAISDKRLTAFISLNDIQCVQNSPVHHILAGIDFLHVKKLILEDIVERKEIQNET